MTQINGQVGPQVNSDGAQPLVRLGRSGEVSTADAHGQLTEASVRGNLFMAHAIVTAPVIYSTAAGTGGPLIWNGSTNKNVNVLRVGIAVTVVTTVAAALGLTGQTGQSSAPGSTTAIDSSRNLLLGGPSSAATAYRIGTPTNAGNFFLPLSHLHTGALTVDTFGMGWFDVSGLLTVPPGGWCSIAASATASTTVAQMAIVWEELPI